MTITVESRAFREGGSIPAQYTCDGRDVSPPLSWSGIPDGTRSLALICDDPDAPGQTWVHWILYKIAPAVRELPEAMSGEEGSLSGAVSGTNDFRRTGYGGPCPPQGEHRYFFKLYALDEEPSLRPGATKAELESAMEGHILGEGALIGRYSRG